MPFWAWVVVVLAALFLLRVVAAVGARIAKLLLLKGIGIVALKSVGDKALAQQPDTIHLSPALPEFTNRSRMENFVAAFQKRGMTEGGTFTIPALPGVVVRFQLDIPDSLYAAIYEHPKLGCWVEVITRYQDHTSTTVTMRPAMGFEQMPGYNTTHMPGASIDALCARLLQVRPKRPMAELSSFNVARLFEEAWADQMRWRKQRGAKADEVARVIIATQEGVLKPGATDKA